MQACYGHTEGAAGVTGLLMALGAAQALEAPGIMGLRSLNPYVGAALEDWANRGQGPLASRQGRPAAALWKENALAGVLSRLSSGFM